MDNTMSSGTDDIARSLARLLYGQEVEEPKRPIADTMARLVEEESVEAAIARYRELRETAADAYDFGEDQLNSLGYRYLRTGEIETAIAIFELNAEMFPEAYNPWDSLAEAYMTAGHREKAIEYYEKSLILNPGNENAKRMLRERLGVEPENVSVDVPVEVLERYVGTYEVGPDFVAEITLENGVLYGQPRGEVKLPLIPVSETEFWVEGEDARVVFDAAGEGRASSLTLHMGGQERVGRRIE